jgi:hypothetical protein
MVWPPFPGAARGTMETIDKLEKSLGNLLAEYGKLREENENLTRDMRIAVEELEKTRETVRTIRSGGDRSGLSDETMRDREAKKRELGDEVRAIIRKIDASIDSHDIDMITNE